MKHRAGLLRTDSARKDSAHAFLAGRKSSTTCQVADRPRGPESTARPITLSLVCTLFLTTMVFSACSTEHREIPFPPASQPSVPSSSSDPLAQGQAVRPEQSYAPWDVNGSLPADAHPLLIEAERAESAKDIETALQRYERAQKESGAPADRKFALERRAGLLLKYGRSAEVLQELAQFSASEGVGLDKLSAPLALIAAFAYQHQKDVDQTFAWLSHAHRLSGGTGVVSQRSKEQAARLIGRIRDDAFEDYARRWSGDQFVSRAIAADRARRQRKSPQRPDASDRDWYSPGTYGFPPTLPLFSGGAEAAPQTAPSPQSASVGILLPLSGTYASHAEQVFRGIQLAAAERDGIAPTDSVVRTGGMKLVAADTAGDGIRAADEYTRLVNQESVRFVLGPLLVRSAEEVASRSQTAQVPFLTFTKREAVTTLSPYALRLGATAADQVADFLTFAQRERGWTKVMLLGTARAMEEFDRSFRMSPEGSQALVTSLALSGNDSTAAAVAIDQIRQFSPDVLFFADAPGQLSEILSQLRNTPDVSQLPRFGGASWGDAVALRSLGDLVNGAYFVTPFLPQSPRPAVRQFLEQFRARFNAEPDLLAAQGYDAAILAFSIMDQTADRTLSPSELRRRRSITGVTGELTIQESGEVRRKMSVVGIQGGELLEVTFGGVPTGAALTTPETR